MFVFNLNKFKNYIFSLAIPLIFGFIGYLLSGNTELYNTIVTPNFAPPSILFPIIWTFLYILMGSSYYIIKFIKNYNNSLLIYYLQLIVNALWPLLFFRFNLFLISAVWIILLIILVIYMIFLFINIEKKAGILQIPYLIWLIFALILNFSIYFLNN